MSSARDRILGRVRQSLGRGELDELARERLNRRLAEPPEFLQARFEGEGLQHFIDKLSSPALTASAERLEGFGDLRAAVQGYLEKNQLAARVCITTDPRLTGLNWAGVEVHHDIDRNEAVSISVAEAGIMETGSLVFQSAPHSPTLHHFLGLHHLAVLEVGNLLPYMEDYWRRFRERGEAHPRNINFVTGSSGTADIEAQLVRGAHGPRFLHILLVGG